MCIAMNELDRLQIELHRWATQTFGADRPPHGAIAHLKREVEELAQNPYDSMEYVDCLTLLLDAASNAGISTVTIMDCAWDKLDINRKREWGEQLPDGTIEHVREPCSHCEGLAAELNDVACHCRECGRLLPIDAGSYSSREGDGE